MTQTVSSISAKADAFKSLHEQSGAFLMPCAWDRFSALLFETGGFSCIGTTSGGVNWVNAREDYLYSTPKAEMLIAYGAIADATQLPVSADLENGYGGNDSDVADTISQSIRQGLVGGSIEDCKITPTDDGFSNGELYPLEIAVDRIKAARSAANDAPYHYTLTARCEVSYTKNTNPLAEAIDRLNAYRDAGADCLFVPGINDLDDLHQLVKEVDGPISFGMGASPEPLTVSMLEDIGIRRISTGGGLTRATFSVIQTAVQEMISTGDFSYLNDVMSESEVNSILRSGAR